MRTIQLFYIMQKKYVGTIFIENSYFRDKSKKNLFENASVYV